MRPDDDPGTRAGHGPARALPVSVGGNLTVVRRHDVFVWVGALCVYATSFAFHLVAGFDTRQVSYPQVGFRRRERFCDPAPARILIRFPDGAMADSTVMEHLRPATGPSLVPCDGTPEPGDMSSARYGRHESRWLVSPLPPAGQLEISVYLRGSVRPEGSALIDAGRVLAGVARAAALGEQDA
jgi:hypothetical protein